MIDHSAENVAQMPPNSHPWLIEFASSPYVAFDNLIRGHSDLGQFNRADVPDAAVQIFGNLNTENGLIAILNECVVRWFGEAQKLPLSNEINRRRRQIGQLCDIFDLVGRLQLAESAKRFYEDRSRITHRPSAFREGDDRDARLSFFTMLAIMQPVLADNDVDVSPLAPLWHELCANAGGGLPIAYLDAGLLGLRRFPKNQNDSEVSCWLAGLIGWGLSQPLTERDFIRKWSALKFLYPRTPTSWKNAFVPLLNQKAIKKISENSENDLLNWLSKDSDLKFLNNMDGYPENTYHYPTIDDYESLEEGIKSNIKLTLNGRLPRFVRSHIRFAELTGVDRFLIIALHRTGTALVKSRNRETAHHAISLAHESMRWQPSDPYSWALWADALEVLGQLRSSEMVRREQLRRLPFHPDAVTQLAEFLIASRRAEEALDLIEAAELIGIANKVALAIKVRIYSKLFGISEAKLQLDHAIKLFPEHDVLHKYRDSLNRNMALKLLSEHYQLFPLFSEEMQTTEQRFELELGELSQKSGILERDPNDLEAKNFVLHFLENDPEQVLAKIISARHGLWSTNRDAMPGFAVAFELALNSHDISVLERLGSNMPRLRALTLIARVIFGDTTAAAEAENWIKAGGQSDDLGEFRDWLAQRWHEAQREASSNVLSFAEFAMKRKEMLLAGTRLAHQGIATSLLLAA